MRNIACTMGAVLRQRDRRKCKRYYQASLSGTRAKEFLAQIVPYLRVKKEQARLAIQFPMLRSGRLGRWYRPDHTLGKVAQAVACKRMGELNQ